MKKLAIVLLAALVVMSVVHEPAEAARCKFHQYLTKGGLVEVYGTINCETVGEPLFRGDIPYCTNIDVWIPPWCNDYLTVNHWNHYTCGNIDRNKVAVKHYVVDHWELRPFGAWMDTVLIGEVTIPGIADSTGVVPEMYTYVDLEEWIADPRPLLDEYNVVNGECPDLPGYLIGTTPIVFDPMAGPGENPFSTTPYTGLVQRDCDMTFLATQAPAFSHWGLMILVALLLAAAIWLVRKRIVAAGSTV